MNPPFFNNDDVFSIGELHDDLSALDSIGQKRIPLEDRIYSKRIVKRPWDSCVYSYKILTHEQRDILDSYFNDNKIKLTKTNMKSISRDLKVPYQRVLDYICEKSQEDCDSIVYNTIRYCNVLTELERVIDNSWCSYLEMADYFSSRIDINDNK
ncbi:hypothetical protein TCON_1697 [Astathelohania contejeani]|uniref:Homeobox domain-containing protein n=1 Tax=Astathelohania contejeani TaxID=164912 RepID=A0ABQ7HY23_9MICR|nr:hypothetical protein TCON_1697 [Thelohania contejeani]